MYSPDRRLHFIIFTAASSLFFFSFSFSFSSITFSPSPSLSFSLLAAIFPQLQPSTVRPKLNHISVPSMDPSPQDELYEAQHNERQEKRQAGFSAFNTTHDSAILHNIKERTPSVHSKLNHGPSKRSNITLSHFENIPSATEIKLSVKNLTLFIVPEPSVVVRLARFLTKQSKRTSTSNEKNKDRHSDYSPGSRGHQEQFESKTGSPAEASSIQHGHRGEESSEDHLQHPIGINIFRHISFDVEPGQGKDRKSYERAKERRDGITHSCPSSVGIRLLIFFLNLAY